MAKLLIHLATGPENPTRGALALLVARTAAEEGHAVQVFIAGARRRSMNSRIVGTPGIRVSRSSSIRACTSR